MQFNEGAVSFVARIWLERGANGDPVWRGHIQYVQTGEERHFCRFTEISDFIECLTDLDCSDLRDKAARQPKHPH